MSNELWKFLNVINMKPVTCECYISPKIFFSKITFPLALNYMHVLFLIPGPSLGFASDASLSDVVLRVNITAENLILNCEVPAYGLQSTTNLYCPLVGRSPCFENCVRSCIVVRGRCIPLDELKVSRKKVGKSRGDKVRRSVR